VGEIASLTTYRPSSKVETINDFLNRDFEARIV
jgi:hypothetical protein